MRVARRALPASILSLLALLAASPARAASAVANFCGQQAAQGAEAQDRLLRFTAHVRSALQAHAQAQAQAQSQSQSQSQAAAPEAGVALIARSGLDLSRFGLRYSHAGLALAQGAGTPWAVRQLYYACDEGRPRLFDQGLAGFVAGTADPDAGYISVVWLPPAAAQALTRTALDRPRALRLLADTYSANAHAWSLRYQNCNQWVMELLAASVADLADGADLRARAQAWLREAGYQPSAVDAGSHAVMFAGGFVPWLRFDDRPEDERHSLVFRVSLPSSIEAFVRARWPEARRMEFCHAAGRVVIREGWTPLAEGCVPGPGDRVEAL
jgi:hypothetical protein